MKFPVPTPSGAARFLYASAAEAGSPEAFAAAAKGERTVFPVTFPPFGPEAFAGKTLFVPARDIYGAYFYASLAFGLRAGKAAGAPALTPAAAAALLSETEFEAEAARRAAAKAEREAAETAAAEAAAAKTRLAAAAEAARVKAAKAKP